MPPEVVVVAFGAPRLLDACLGTLGVGHTVTVVDNSSRSDVQTIVEGHGARYLDPGANLGFAGGVNLGLERRDRNADVLLLNPDAAITAEAVVELQRCLHAHSGRGCVAPAQSDPVTGAPARVAWPFPSPGGAWLEAVGLGRMRRAHDFMIGSVLLIRADTLTDVGRFDERFFLYAEETDWQRRARSHGWEITLCPEVASTHVGAGTGGDTSDRESHFHASNERYMRKHHGTLGWWVFRTGVMAGALVRAMVLPGPRGRLAADRFHRYRRGPVRAEAGAGRRPPPVHLPS